MLKINLSLLHSGGILPNISGWVPLFFHGNQDYFTKNSGFGSQNTWKTLWGLYYGINKNIQQRHGN